MIRIAALLLQLLLAPNLVLAAGTLTVNPGDTCTTTCVAGTTAPPVICIPPKVSQGGVCVDPAPACVPPQVLQGGVCVTPGGPVDPGTISCPGFGKTISLVANWAAPARLYALTMGPDDAIVVKLTVGNDPTPSNNLARMAGAEWSSTPSTRIAVLSPKPCDFEDQPGTAGAKVSDKSVTVPFAVGGLPPYGYYPAIPPGATVYFNIKNDNNTACALGLSPTPCGMAIDLTHPSSVTAGASLAKALAVPASAQTAKALKAKAAKK